ncbi:hypothetical protein P3875_08200 [Myroides sp. JBRI-B21084]|uniref:hypothetical protein n=1 Tax=Myroides sp. JBRI-B21084 TaxID=3119977 RepID=UPI0026E11814|nr:hypothetical protein [Paenimyroides cloacae]WKW45767.1 hypothetical protein P3875_08200 [Paenimyroides cloacae]
MKKIITLCIPLLFAACNKSDDYVKKNAIAEVPPEGLKIRQREDKYIFKYYYHQNGFIDSVYVMKESEISHKFFYNEFNQITEDHYLVKNLTDPSAYTKRITKYTYNRFNQISKATVYDKNNQLQYSLNYEYNTEGYLYNPTKIVKNENLIAENSYDYYQNYTFDTTRNPYYNIFPKAFKIIKYINKNNIIKHEVKMPHNTIEYTFDLRYNESNYVSTQMMRENGSDKEYTHFHYY